MLVSNSILKQIYQKRKSNAHKYEFGSLLVIGGSKLYSGSPAFAAMAAYRTGVDLVTVVAPERAANIVAAFSPDLITYPLDGDFLKAKHLKTLFEFSNGRDAVVIGGGLERRKETMKTIAEFLKKTDIPCVIDADAIHTIDGSVIKPNFIITPHANEFYVLSGKKVVDMNVEEKIKNVKKIALKLNATILLKGNPDIISNGKETAVNKTGNPYMTVGGTGDTLAGICGSLLAQRIEPFAAACGAAYINGKAGDIVAKEKKQSMTASDLIENICRVL